MLRSVHSGYRCSFWNVQRRNDCFWINGVKLKLLNFISLKETELIKVLNSIDIPLISIEAFLSSNDIFKSYVTGISWIFSLLLFYFLIGNILVWIHFRWSHNFWIAVTKSIRNIFVSPNRRLLVGVLGLEPLIHFLFLPIFIIQYIL